MSLYSDVVSILSKDPFAYVNEIMNKHFKLYNKIKDLTSDKINAFSDELAKKIFSNIDRENIKKQAEEGVRRFLIFEGGNYLIDFEDKDKSTGFFTIIPKTYQDTAENIFDDNFNLIKNGMIVSEFSTAAQKVKRGDDLDSSSFDRYEPLDKIMLLVSFIGNIYLISNAATSKKTDISSSMTEVELDAFDSVCKPSIYTYCDNLGNRIKKIGDQSPEFKGFNFSLKHCIEDRGDYYILKLCVFMNLGRNMNHSSYVNNSTSDLINDLKKYNII